MRRIFSQSKYFLDEVTLWIVLVFHLPLLVIQDVNFASLSMTEKCVDDITQDVRHFTTLYKIIQDYTRLYEIYKIIQDYTRYTRLYKITQDMQLYTIHTKFKIQDTSLNKRYNALDKRHMSHDPRCDFY